MTWLLDGNVLLALHVRTHIHHERAHRWFGSELSARFATCVITQGALLRLHMRTAADHSPAAAWRVLEGICRHPKHIFWGDPLSYSEVPHRQIMGHAQVTDAWLAQLARLRKGRLATMDSGLDAMHRDVAFLIPV